MTHMMHKYDLQLEDFHSLSKNKIKEWCYEKWFSNINNHYFTYAQVIREMIMMKENKCVRSFSDADINFIIEYLCII